MQIWEISEGQALCFIFFGKGPVGVLWAPDLHARIGTHVSGLLTGYLGNRPTTSSKVGKLSEQTERWEFLGPFNPSQGTLAVAFWKVFNTFSVSDGQAWSLSSVARLKNFQVLSAGEGAKKNARTIKR